MKIKKYLFAWILFLMVAMPALSFAQELPTRPVTPMIGSFQGVTQATYSPCYAEMDDIGDLICRIGELLNSIVPVLVALGVLYMVFGIVQYVIGDSEEAKGKGKDRIIYGIIGLAVILSLWGLVSVVVNTFDLNKESAPDINITNFTLNGQPASGGMCDSELGSNPKLQNLLTYATCLIAKSVIPLIFVLATAAFVWGVVNFLLLGGDSDEKRAQGRQFMLWGIIALTVMLGVWGLVNILGRTFGIDRVIIPQIQSRSGQNP